MSKLNRQELIGHLGTDVKIHTFEDGKQQGRVSINDGNGYYNESGQWIDNSSWHYVVIRDALLKRKKDRLVKGAKVYVSGRTVRRKHDNKEYVEIHALYIEQLVTAQ